MSQNPIDPSNPTAPELMSLWKTWQNTAEGQCPFHHSDETKTSETRVDLGQKYDPLSPEQVADPYTAYALSRKEQPVFYSPKYEMWFVTRFEDILTVVKDPATFSSHGIITLFPERYVPEVGEILKKGIPQLPGMTDNDPPGHTRLRTLLGPAFSTKNILALAPLVEKIATELVHDFILEDGIEFIQGYAFPFAFRVMTEVLGIPRQDLVQLKKWCDDWVALLSADLSGPQQISCAKSFVAFQHYCLNLVTERRKSPRSDLITAMIQAQAEGLESLHDYEVVTICMSLVWAGSESVTSLITSLLYRLLSEPKRWEAVQTQPELISQAIEETLRMDSPLQGMLRFTKKSTALGGVEIPAGAPMQILFGSANRDETVFPNPDVFDLARAEKGHLALGKGIHQCMGAQLVRLECKISLETLAKNLKNLRMKPDQKLSYLPNFIYRTLQSLEVEWDPKGVC